MNAAAPSWYVVQTHPHAEPRRPHTWSARATRFICHAISSVGAMRGGSRSFLPHCFQATSLS